MSRLCVKKGPWKMIRRWVLRPCDSCSAQSQGLAVLRARLLNVKPELHPPQRKWLTWSSFLGSGVPLPFLPFLTAHACWLVWECWQETLRRIKSLEAATRTQHVRIHLVLRNTPKKTLAHLHQKNFENPLKDRIRCADMSSADPAIFSSEPAMATLL